MPNQIFPPVLPSKQYSFLYHSGNQYPGPTGNNDYFMQILFEMPAMTDTKTIGHVQVSLRYVDTNVCAIQEGCSPDRATLFISAANSDFAIDAGGAVTVPANPYFRRSSVGSNIWELNIPFRVFDGGPRPSTNYSVQIRFGLDDLWTGAQGGAGDYGLQPNIGYGEFAGWRMTQTKAVPSNFGEWSNTTTIFCYERPGLDFSSNFNNFVPQICWTYDPKSDDPIAQIELHYTYEDIHGKQNAIKTFSGATANDNKYSLITYLDVAPFFQITGTIVALTQNNTKIEYPFAILPLMIKDVEDKDQGIYTVWDSGEVINKELVGEEQNDGIISKTMITHAELSEDGDKTVSVYRCNLLSLNTVKVVDKLSIIKDQKANFKDYTVEMGERYMYVFCIMDSENRLDQFFISPTPYGASNPGYGRLMSMEALYLTTRNHQLRCIGNLTISNFKRNTTDGFQTTLGAKYPFYTRNSENNYRTLQVSCAISINFDPTSVFLRLDPQNGLMWDEGVQTAYEQQNNGDPQELTVLKQELVELEAEYDEWAAKVDTTAYYNNPSYHNEVNYNLAKYDALVQQKKAQIEIYSPTRGSTSLYILNEDLYDFAEISLSRRRMMQRDTEGESIVQESAIDPYGMPELATGDYVDEDGYAHTSRFLRGPQSIYSPFLHQESGVVYDTSNDDRMVYLERKFRDRVMEWLSDGKPKLLRSEHEGNMIVIVTQPSFTPLQATGRKVYTVSFTATEIAEYNLENLIDYNLIPSVIENDYSEVNPLAFNPGEPDPNVSLTLAWSHLDNYAVPNTETGTAIEPIPLSMAIINNMGTIEDGQLTIKFSNNKPAWLTTKIENGILYLVGTPAAGDISDPITIQVTAVDAKNPDGEANTAVGQLSIGTIYTGIAINPLSDQGTMKVGDELTPIPVADYTVGGVGVKTWAAANLPYGFTINALTGEITGIAAEECPDGKTAVISVRDEDGNMATQTLVFDHIGPELYLAGQGLYSIPLSEVGVAIDEINLGPNASGGNPFTDADGKDYYEFYMTNAPEGITIDKTTGVISGTPTVENDSARLITVTAVDENGDMSSIDINCEQVLPAFEIQPYEYDPNSIMVGGLRTYNFSMTSGGVETPGAPMTMRPIPVGEKVSNYWTWIINNPEGITLEDGSVLAPSIKGGLPFEEKQEDGTIHKYYELIGEGLLPNFKLDAITGKITGMPTVGWDQKTAIVRVRDKRGEYARDSRAGYPDYIIITVSQVVSTMTVQTTDSTGKAYEYRLPETTRNNKDPNNNWVIPTNEYQIVFPMNRIKNGQFNNLGDSYFRMENFPTGFSGHYDAASNSYIITADFNNLPPAIGRTAYLYVSDDTKDAMGNRQTVSIPMYIGTIYETLNWNEVNTQIKNIYTGDNFELLFSGLYGGKAPYKFTIKSGGYLPPGITLAKPEAEYFGVSGFKGTFTNPCGARNITVTLQDSLGQTRDVTFRFSAIYNHLKVEINTATNAEGTSLYHRMSNYNFLIGVTTVPQTGNILQPIIVSGGSGAANYRYTYNVKNIAEYLGGLTFINGKNGIVAGSINTEVRYSKNLKGIVEISDAVSGESIILDFDLMTARCWKQPDNKGGATVNVAGLTAYQPIDSSKYSNLIDTFGNYSAQSSSSGLPAGILFDDAGDRELSGTPTVAASGIKATITITTESNPWTPLKTYNRPVNFASIAGMVTLNVNNIVIPAIGVGDKIGIPDGSGNLVDIRFDNTGKANGGTLSGGQTPYKLTSTVFYDNNGDKISNLPGISIRISGNALIISGTATGTVLHRGKIYIQVEDANGSKSEGYVEYNGFYPKLRITNGSPIRVPAAYANVPITPITITTSGGYGSIGFTLQGGSKYGYSIGGTDANQIVGPTGLSSVKASTGKVIATDTVGQTAEITVNFGALTGQLNYDSDKVAAFIPAGKVGTAITAINLGAGVIDGKPPVTWRLVDVPAGWTLNINATGNLTGTRPATAMGAGSCYAVVSDDTNPSGIRIPIQLGAVTQ